MVIPFTLISIFIAACISIHHPHGQYTPGPWLVDTSIGTVGDNFTIYRDHRPTPQSGPRVVVALIPGSKLHMADPEARDANARLIASAPNLDLYRMYVNRKITIAELPIRYSEYLESELIKEDRVSLNPY